MNALHLGFVGLRMLGLWYGLQSLLTLNWLLLSGGQWDTSFAGNNAMQFSLGYIFQTVATAGLGLVLFFFAQPLALRLFSAVAPDAEDTPTDVAVPTRELTRVGMCLLGVYFVGSSVGSVVSWLAQLFWHLGGERRDFLSGWFANSGLDMLTMATMFVFGLFLLHRTRTWNAPLPNPTAIEE